MAIEQDWRYMGQDRYLQGKKLVKKSFCHGDHAHCCFCQEKFSNKESDLKQGYCTLDEKHWICEKCYLDFCESFSWIVVVN